VASPDKTPTTDALRFVKDGGFTDASTALEAAVAEVVRLRQVEMAAQRYVSVLGESEWKELLEALRG
jgi:hypothetical protein